MLRETRSGVDAERACAPKNADGGKAGEPALAPVLEDRSDSCSMMGVGSVDEGGDGVAEAERDEPYSSESGLNAAQDEGWESAESSVHRLLDSIELVVVVIPVPGTEDDMSLLGSMLSAVAVAHACVYAAAAACCCCWECIVGSAVTVLWCESKGWCACCGALEAPAKADEEAEFCCSVLPMSYGVYDANEANVAAGKAWADADDETAAAAAAAAAAKGEGPSR